MYLSIRVGPFVANHYDVNVPRSGTVGEGMPRIWWHSIGAKYDCLKHAFSNAGICDRYSHELVPHGPHEVDLSELQFGEPTITSRDDRLIR